MTLIVRVTARAAVAGPWRSASRAAADACGSSSSSGRPRQTCGIVIERLRGQRTGRAVSEPSWSHSSKERVSRMRSTLRQRPPTADLDVAVEGDEPLAVAGVERVAASDAAGDADRSRRQRRLAEQWPTFTSGGPARRRARRRPGCRAPKRRAARSPPTTTPGDDHHRRRPHAGRHRRAQPAPRRCRPTAPPLARRRSAGAMAKTASGRPAAAQTRSCASEVAVDHDAHAARRARTAGRRRWRSRSRRAPRRRRASTDLGRRRRAEASSPRSTRLAPDTSASERARRRP